MAWVTPPTFTALGAATAAMFNKIRDCLNALGDSWPTYTPVITASTTNPTMGASTVAGRFRLVGKTVDVQIEITIGSGFSPGSGGYTFSLPSGVSPVNNGASAAFGVGSARDVSVPTSRGYVIYYVSSTQVGMFKNDDGVVVGSAAPFVWAVGDRISINIGRMEIV